MSDLSTAVTMQAALRSIGSLELNAGGAKIGSLEQEFDAFKASRDQLKEQLEGTESLLTNEFSEKLSPQFSALLLENLKLKNVRQKIDQLYNGSQKAGSQDSSKPCIIIVGQTKAGKSSFINELLGGTFVAQSQSPCTARVTRLTYSERNYVLVRSKSGQQVGEIKFLEKPNITEELVKLKDEDRDNEELTSSTVEAGINCEFLRHGIDIIDSPGLNENPSLDSLTLGAVSSVLPIIIYVIDSNSGITVAVQEDLTIIHKSVAQVLYLVTKMDVSKESVEDEGRSGEEIEKEKSERVFKKLKRLGYISEMDGVDSCDNFLCVSCWTVRDFRRKKEAFQKRMLNRQADQPLTATEQKQLNELKELPNSKWVRRFEEVKKRILKFAQDQFCAFITAASEDLRNLNCQILTMFMDKAHNLHESHMRKKRALEQIKAVENLIYLQSKEIIEKHSAEFLTQVELLFKTKIPAIVEEAKYKEYSDSCISEKMSSNQIETNCVEDIQSFINDRIMFNFKDSLKQGAFKNIFLALESLKAKVEEYEKDIDQTPAYQVLKRGLLQGFKLPPDDILFSRFKCFFRNLGLKLQAIKNAGVFLKTEVKNPIWKEYHAKTYINSIDKKSLSGVLISFITGWFDNQHREFLDNLGSSEILVESGQKLSEKERMEIKSLYPKVALLHMHTLDVVTRYKYRGFKLDTTGSIGSGGQGEVFRVLDENGAPALAAKRIVSEDDAALGDIATEVYHSSFLDHPNIIRVIGITLSKNGSKWVVDLYMALMHCDITTLMQQNRLPLKKRLGFGLAIAKALEFLHKDDLIHRDVKPSNLLVSEDLSQVKLADFGVARRAGLVEHTIAGTPIFMAPELFLREDYDTSVDIFSLGITLWYICEGSGERHPGYVRIVPSIGAALILGAIGFRPEPLNDIPVSLWELMCACWNDTPSERPTATQVAEALQKLVNAV